MCGGKESYQKISTELQRKIETNQKNGWRNLCRFKDSDAVRRNENVDKANLWRPVFVRDIEKILHLPVYNRYADKTQVFSLYHNDDLTRRGLHVQLVSRIARSIGSVLDLNLDLIEAIALGHDIGHTPFGHAGERFLDEIVFLNTKRHFNHNVHSVRVLEKLYKKNITLQTLDGILCHNGEFELQKIKPDEKNDFSGFDGKMAECYEKGNKIISTLLPTTLEGSLVRICDMIAYVGKDRQDAKIAKVVPKNHKFSSNIIGNSNAKIINNLSVDIIENSYEKDYISLSEGAFEDLTTAKKENYEIIYKNKKINDMYNSLIKPMFEEMFEKLKEDYRGTKKPEDSMVGKHHIVAVFNWKDGYLEEGIDWIIADYMASMTDNYFIALHKELFPGKKSEICYQPYF